PDILEEHPESVKTGRMIDQVAGEAPGWSSKTGRIRKKANGKQPSAPSASAQKQAALAGPDPSKIKGAKKAPLPDFVEPTLATLVASPPGGDRWLHEIKFDGYRL